VRAPGPADHADLDLWCDGVGPPLVLEGRPPGGPGSDRLVLVSWNVYVGGGDLAGFIRELRAGEPPIPGPVSDFVVLVQEALRTGPVVPEDPPLATPGGGLIHNAPPSGAREGIEEIARREGLFAFYVPSMRNGGVLDREDRGNAILSTLPLTDLAAIELPYERQRRVALSARVGGRDGSGAPFSLRVVSVHLDNWSRWTQVLDSFGSGRARQIRGLLDWLGDAPAVALGGDFNTWYGERGEPAIGELQSHFRWPRSHPNVKTHGAFGSLVDRQVDYFFFQLPKGWQAHYRVLEDKRGSDHRPLLAELFFRGAPPAAASPH